jgi:hypothetical protein
MFAYLTDRYDNIHIAHELTERSPALIWWENPHRTYPQSIW